MPFISRVWFEKKSKTYISVSGITMWIILNHYLQQNILNVLSARKYLKSNKDEIILGVCKIVKSQAFVFDTKISNN